jgi:hypothetical protein
MLIQSLLQQTAYALIAALLILGVLIMLGVGLGNREKFRDRNIEVYAWAIILPVTLVFTIYFYLEGAFTLNETIIMSGLLLFFSLWIDWTKLWKSKSISDLDEEKKE